MLGDNLLGLTSKRELLIDSGSYEERSTASSRLPGALVNKFKMTLWLLLQDLHLVPLDGFI